jgi:hypothetical protein
MVMTIAKITAGDGYLYLTRHTAHGDAEPGEQHDAAAYYTAEGNPPGRWIGRGAPLLGLAGQQVTEEQMRALFGHGEHPDADAIIDAYLKEHARPDMTAKQLENWATTRSGPPGSAARSPPTGRWTATTSGSASVWPS